MFFSNAPYQWWLGAFFAPLSSQADSCYAAVDLTVAPTFNSLFRAADPSSLQCCLVCAL